MVPIEVISIGKDLVSLPCPLRAAINIMTPVDSIMIDDTSLFFRKIL